MAIAGVLYEFHRIYFFAQFYNFILRYSFKIYPVLFFTFNQELKHTFAFLFIVLCCCPFHVLFTNIHDAKCRVILFL